MTDAESAVAYLQAVVPVMRALCVTEYAGLKLGPDASLDDAPQHEASHPPPPRRLSARGAVVPRVVVSTDE
jgi:hypothetical protein